MSNLDVYHLSHLLTTLIQEVQVKNFSKVIHNIGFKTVNSAN